MQNGAVWRIQLGPFADKAQASAVQQRLQSEAQLQSLLLAPTKRRGPPVHLAHVKVINKLMRNVGCWPAEHLL